MSYRSIITIRATTKTGLMRSARSPVAAGFTLIELVVAVAILAIIVAIAIPSYTNQVLRSNRTEAIDELLRQAAFQQATYTRTNAFVAVANYQTNNNRYRIRTILDNGGQSYTLRAVPLNAQVNDTCGNLTLDNLGRKTAQGNNVDCWSGRNG